jgi:hypothetical protein
MLKFLYDKIKVLFSKLKNLLHKKRDPLKELHHIDMTLMKETRDLVNDEDNSEHFEDIDL